MYVLIVIWVMSSTVITGTERTKNQISSPAIAMQVFDSQTACDTAAGYIKGILAGSRIDAFCVLK